MLLYDPLVLYSVLNVFGLIILLITIITSSSNFKNANAHRVFVIAILVLMVMFVFDTLYAAIDMGRIKGASINITYIIKNLYFAGGLFEGYFWFIYFEMTIKSKFSKNNKAIIFSSFFVFVGILMLIINRFNQYMFKIHNDTVDGSIIYDRTSIIGFTFFYFCIYAYVVVSSVRCFIFARRKEHFVERQKYAFVGFIASTPIPFGILQLIYPKLPLVCVGLTLSTIILYVYATKDQVSNDNLTDLLNRKRVLRGIERSLKLKSDDGTLYVVFMVDINNFKHINDTYGHLEGDSALICAAEALTKVSMTQKRKMIVGRYGGDEFLIGAHLDHEYEIEVVKDQINNELRIQKENKNKEYDLISSIGHAIYSSELNTIKDLIEAADKALYESKVECEKKMEC